MIRVAVVGVGAIGGVVAGLLQAAGGHEVVLCTLRPLRELRVTMPDGVVEVQAANATDPETVEPVDWVLVATKTYQTEGTGRWLDRLCKEGAPVAVLQNGVEHRERFAPYVAAERILPVVIDCPAERRGDGDVLQRGIAKMTVESGALGRGFAKLFEGCSQGSVTLTDDFVTAVWRKLCINAAGAINALTMKPAGVLREEELGRLAVEMVAECAAVGRAEGAHLEDEIGEQVLAGYRAQSPESVNSMLADRMAGRPMEIDARNGVIVRRGERHGIAVRLNEMAVALLRAVGESALG